MISQLFLQTSLQAGRGEVGVPFVNAKALRNLTVPQLGNHDQAYWEWAFSFEDQGMQYAQFLFFPLGAILFLINAKIKGL